MGLNIAREVAGMMAVGAVAREPWDTIKTRAVASDAMGTNTSSYRRVDMGASYAQATKWEFAGDVIVRTMNAGITALSTAITIKCFVPYVVEEFRDGILKDPWGRAMVGVHVLTALIFLSGMVFFGIGAFAPEPFR